MGNNREDCIKLLQNGIAAYLLQSLPRFSGLVSLLSAASSPRP